MVDEPVSNNPKPDFEGYLSVKIEGKLAIENSPGPQGPEAEHQQPHQAAQRILWYMAVWGWFIRLKDDPNAFVTALATLVIAAFTAELYCVSNH